MAMRKAATITGLTGGVVQILAVLTLVLTSLFIAGNVAWDVLGFTASALISGIWSSLQLSPKLVKHPVACSVVILSVVIFNLFYLCFSIVIYTWDNKPLPFWLLIYILGWVAGIVLITLAAIEALLSLLALPDPPNTNKSRIDNKKSQLN